MLDFRIDGETLLPQPDSHEWESEQDGVLGYDGAGAPIKKKYRSCRLRCQHSLAYQRWSQYDDGATHTVSLPAPGSLPGDFTDYTGCYIVVNHGSISRGAAMEGIEMLITGAQAYS